MLVENVDFCLLLQKSETFGMRILANAFLNKQPQEITGTLRFQHHCSKSLKTYKDYLVFKKRAKKESSTQSRSSLMVKCQHLGWGRNLGEEEGLPEATDVMIRRCLPIPHARTGAAFQ